MVIVTRNRRVELLENVPRLLALPDRPPVVVVDNASDDGTVASVADTFPEVRLAAAGRNLGPAGRNLGVAMAETPYVAFADDDSWWEPGALARAADLLDHHPRLAVVAARVLVGQQRRPDPTCREMAGSRLSPAPDLPGSRVLGFIACGAVVRRHAFLAVGGFDELMHFGGEESLLAFDLAAAGWGLSYVEDVVAVHFPSPLRNRDLRRRCVVRNDLLRAWLRRRWPAAARHTLSVARSAIHDPAAFGGLLDAAARAPEVLRHRRPLPPELDGEVELLAATAG